MKKSPKYGVLELDKNYEFEFYVPRAYQLAIIDSDQNFDFFERDNGIFRIQYQPKFKGELKIGIQHEKGGKSFHTIMRYQVQKEALAI